RSIYRNGGASFCSQAVSVWDCPLRRIVPDWASNACVIMRAIRGCNAEAFPNQGFGQRAGRDGAHETPQRGRKKRGPQRGLQNSEESQEGSQMKLDMPPFQQARVLVAGDVMLDRYWHGKASR